MTPAALAARDSRRGPTDAPLLTDLRRLDALLARGVEAAREDEPSVGEAPALPPHSSRMLELGTLLGLNEFDLDIVLLALGCELDSRYGRLFAYLHDDASRRRPTVDLALMLLSPSTAARLEALARFAPNAPLRAAAAVRFVGDVGNAEPPFVEQTLRLERYALTWLLEAEQRDRPWSLPADNDELAHSAPTVRSSLDRVEGPRHFVLVGASRRRARRIADLVAGELGGPVVAIDAGDAALDPALALIVRLRRAVLFVEHGEALDREDTSSRDILAAAAAGAGAVVVHAPGSSPGVFEIVPDALAVRLATPSSAARGRSWRRGLGDPQLADDTVAALATRFDLHDSEIHDAFVRAQRAAHVSGASLDALLLDAVRGLRRPQLWGLARRVEPRFGWGDIVLPRDQMDQLREICAQVRMREDVLASGFGRKYHLRRSLPVLFSGPSGTGKSMAAEVVASELDLDLYRIDLSQVVDKYIGETEKRLERVFSAAEGSTVVLFFDEADALFGKRSETKDAHDRYANLELAYLLQRIEFYDGPAILTTNLRANIDDAFIRRLSFAIEFPIPDAVARAEIWRRVWPAEVKLASDVDLEFLATTFELAGAFIRNIAINAAHIAASERATPSMTHLVRATRREYQKLGHALVDNEFGPYAPLLDAEAA